MTYARRRASKKRWPSSRQFVPHRYQEEAITHLLENPNAGLFFNPGLGKTAITLQALRILLVESAIKSALVLAPLRVIYNVWPDEIHKWEQFQGLSYTTLHGPKKKVRLHEDTDIYLCNPEGMKWLVDTDIWSKVDMLVIDESSMWRNHMSQRFKLLRKKLEGFRRRIILTGTPVPNGLLQLWSQVYIVDRGIRLEKYITHYRKKYFYPDFRPYGTEWTLRPGAADAIYDRISDVIVHKSNDELDLPPLVRNVIKVKLSRYAQQMYDDLKKKFRIEIEERGVEAINAGVLSTKLKQMTGGGVYDENQDPVYIHNEKIEALAQLIDELEGQPLLVFYQYRHELERLRDTVLNAPSLSGDTSPKEGEEIIHAWNNDELQVLYLHPASGGHGLNLQEGSCRAACWFSIPWDLEHYEQATARLWRQGQKGTVVLHHIVAADTIDVRVMQALAAKESVQNALLESLM